MFITDATIVARVVSKGAVATHAATPVTVAAVIIPAIIVAGTTAVVTEPVKI